MITTPAAISSSVRISPASPAAEPLSCSPSQSQPRATEITGSHTVIMDSTGASSVPDWKAFSLSRNPSGPTIASA